MTEQFQAHPITIDGQPDYALNAAAIRALAALAGKPDVGEQIIRGEFDGTVRRVNPQENTQ